MPRMTPKRIRPIISMASAALHRRTLANTFRLQIVHLPKSRETLDKSHALFARDLFSAEGRSCGFGGIPPQTDLKAIVYRFSATILSGVRPIGCWLAHKPPPKVF
jgi:hypothetical protein